MKKTREIVILMAAVLGIAACTGKGAVNDGGTQEVQKEELQKEDIQMGDTHTGEFKDIHCLIQGGYPKTAPYPFEEFYMDETTGELDFVAYDKAYSTWWEDKSARHGLAAGNTEGVQLFMRNSLPVFCKQAAGQNVVYSPLNIYVTLGMLAQSSEGESREQILQTVGAESMEELNEKINALWNANYSDDGAQSCILANSLWLEENLQAKEEALQILSDTYYASVYQGKMGTETMDLSLQKWLKEQTRGLLDTQVEQQHLDADTLMALASTIYFNAKWNGEFSEALTEDKVFHGAKGDETVPFMNRSENTSIYSGQHFTAVEKYMDGTGPMCFILPEENVSLEELLAEEELQLFLTTDRMDWKKQKRLQVNLSVPRFDVNSELDLISGLEELGIRDVFDENKADFGGILDESEEAFLSKVQHDARVKVDEEGVEATAFTLMVMSETAMESLEEVDFVLDRPFLFVIQGVSNTPLFVGMVNTVSGDGSGERLQTLNTNTVQESTPKMFYYRDRLYVETDETNSMVRCGNLDFNIDSVIGEGEIPRENGQANFRTGQSADWCGGQYSWRENRIEFPIDGAWHIFAYHENDLDGVSMKVVANTDHSVKVEFNSESEQEMLYGQDFQIEHRDPETGEWLPQAIVVEGEYGFEDIGYQLVQGETSAWETDYTWLYGKLEAGEYRIVKRVSVQTQIDKPYEVHWCTATFTVG